MCVCVKGVEERENVYVHVCVCACVRECVCVSGTQAKKERISVCARVRVCVCASGTHTKRYKKALFFLERHAFQMRFGILSYKRISIRGEGHHYISID